MIGSISPETHPRFNDGPAAILTSHSILNAATRLFIVLWTTFRSGCEMAYIFGKIVVFSPTNHREIAYIISERIVKWPTFYREIADIYGHTALCFQWFEKSQPLNHECLLTLQTGLRPSVDVFLSFGHE